MATASETRCSRCSTHADDQQARRKQGDAARPARQRRDNQSRSVVHASRIQSLALISVRGGARQRAGAWRTRVQTPCRPAAVPARHVDLTRRIRRNCGQAQVTPHAPALQLRRPRRRGPAASHHQPGGAPRLGSAGAGARRGRLRLRHRRQALHRGPGGAVVHGARLRQRRAGRDGARADVAALLLAPVRRPQPRAGHRAGREDQGAWRPCPTSKVFFTNSGSEANDTQIKIAWYYNNALRPAEEEEDHLPPTRLPRHHRRHRQPVGPGRVPRRLRPADGARAAHRLPALRQVRRARRERGGVREPARPQPRGA